MLNTNITIDRQTLEDTIGDLSESQSLLSRERDGINARIAALEERIKSLRSKLEQSARTSNGKSPRLRKGEGVNGILKVLTGENGVGLSQAQIVEKTGISGASVYRTLTKNPDKFVRGSDDLWRLKK
jgi:septal ring factor EnvC (AmiA/AmiB activator)